MTFSIKKKLKEQPKHFIEGLRKVPVQSFQMRDRQFDLLRDDLIHPVVSGNKLRKLWKFLLKSTTEQKGIQTFGGPYSNHLAATAYATHVFGIRSRAFVRGGYHSTPTLQFCHFMGMELIPMNKEEYASRKNDTPEDEHWITVPEGGKSRAGVESVIESYGSILQSYQEIWLAAGTLTTAIGVALSAPHAKVVAVPVLKANGESLMSEFAQLHGVKKPDNLYFVNNQHAGGYARWNANVLYFANEFYLKTGIMTDLVYTAKAFKAFFSAENSPPDVRKLLIHTGGLQGMMGILPQIKAKNQFLTYEAPLVAHLRHTHPGAERTADK